MSDIIKPRRSGTTFAKGSVKGRVMTMRLLFVLSRFKVLKFNSANDDKIWGILVAADKWKMVSTKEIDICR